MDSVGEGEGGKIWENGIETCIISCMKRVASPGSMHDTGCLGLVHWDDPEGWYDDDSPPHESHAKRDVSSRAPWTGALDPRGVIPRAASREFSLDTSGNPPDKRDSSPGGRGASARTPAGIPCSVRTQGGIGR